MGVKVGQIVDVEAPPVGKVYRLTLASGERVYVPRQWLETIPDDLPPDTTFVFVERGPLGRVEWIGVWDDVPRALADGEVTSQEAVAAGFHADGSALSLDEIVESIANQRRR